MPPTERRRRPIPEGTPTERIKVTVTRAEGEEIRRQARERGVSPGDHMVGSTLHRSSGISPADAAMLAVELLAMRQELARNRLARTPDPQNRDDFDLYLGEVCAELLKTARGIFK